MANKSQGSVRMGPVSLFTLVIVLCLAVMAVLSLSTAKATLASTERQATSTTETYQLESDAQRFLANADAALANVRAWGGGHDAGVAALAAEGEGLYAGISDDTTVSMQIAGENITNTSDGGEAAASEGSADEGAADDSGAAATSDTAATEEIIDETTASTDAAADSADATESAQQAADESGYDADVTITFTTESGRCLAVQLAVNNDGTYQILQWKTTVLWNTSSENEVLWSGAATTD